MRVLSNPSVEIGVMVIIALYATMAKLTGSRFLHYQVISLTGALVILVLTLDGPIDALEDARLFTAHMLQHLSLALVIPPLLLIGTPDWFARPLVSLGPIRALFRLLTYPIFAYLFYNLILVGIHSTRVFDLMCRDEGFHIVIHLILLGAAVFLWWPLLSPIPEMPRLSYPAQMLYLFFWLIPMAAVAAPITLASAVIYPWYQEGQHPFGLSPLADQVLGGLVMWVGAGFYMIGVFTAIYFHWARRDDSDEPQFNFVSGATSRTGADGTLQSSLKIDDVQLQKITMHNLTNS